MTSGRVAVVGAGVAGLVAAIDLARAGREVVVLEAASEPGGKLCGLRIGDQILDGGPTVLTMKWIFDEIFVDASASFDARVPSRRAEILARHAWQDGACLDLYPEVERSAAAIEDVFGRGEADGYRRFVRDARAVFETLDSTFVRSIRPSTGDLVRAHLPSRLPELWRIRPFSTLWRALGDYFVDPRLRQLFGRYATYVGSSPFRSPATLMLIAHVERAGVWLIEGGLHSLGRALAELAIESGVTLRCGARVTDLTSMGTRVGGVALDDGERIDAATVVLCGDTSALASGHFGTWASRTARVRGPRERSLSAVTWALIAETEGFPLVRHNVFFSGDSEGEFDALFRRRSLPADATVYVCAQDRGAELEASYAGPERLLCLVNAPATGDVDPWRRVEMDRYEERVFEELTRRGLRIRRRSEATLRTTPHDWNHRFPGTGGALYGPTSHGWRASFARPGPRTALSGLYLAGGSTHPGAGVPMSALSGRQAAAAIIADHASTTRCRATVTAGGTSTPSATTPSRR